MSIDTHPDPWPIISNCVINLSSDGRIYKIDDARAFLTESGVHADRLAPQVEDRFASAFVRARKPEPKRS